MLLASDVWFACGKREILREVSLTLKPGELVAVIGPNGSGKSTLLQLLSGAQKARKGAITLNGVPLNRLPRQDLARQRAVLSQTSTLNFPFRALEVVLLGRSPHANRTAQRENLQVAEAAMQEVEVLHLADRVFTTLSGGEQQRVQLARALAQIWPSPDKEGERYLLLDEPTNNLDLAHQHAVLQIGRRLAERGTGVLMILHDPNLASLYADRIVVLKKGTVLIEGLPEEVLTEATLANAFNLAVMVQRHPNRNCPYIIPA